MTTSIHQLLTHTRRHVTPKDILAYAPMQSGYQQYVRDFTDILETGTLPTSISFSITETIELTQWIDAEQDPQPQVARRFRTFTNAVGLSLYAAHEAGGINYLGIGLIDDGWSLQDPGLLLLLRPAFDEFHDRLLKGKSEEAPFILLGMILLHLMSPGNDKSASALADQLMAEEQAIECHRDAAFLWGCTWHNAHHARWTRYARQFLAPSTPSLSLIRDALLAPAEI